MTDSGLRLASLVLSAVSTLVAVGSYIAILQIRNAVLTERDVMKDWVREQIRMAVS